MGHGLYFSYGKISEFLQIRYRILSVGNISQNPFIISYLDLITTEARNMPGAAVSAEVFGVLKNGKKFSEKLYQSVEKVAQITQVKLLKGAVVRSCSFLTATPPPIQSFNHVLFHLSCAKH